MLLSIFFKFQVMGFQQYVVKPAAMDRGADSGENTAIPAGSSGVISETALAHAPALTEQLIRDTGVPLEEAIQQVRYAIPSTLMYH